MHRKREALMLASALTVVLVSTGTALADQAAQDRLTINGVVTARLSGEPLSNLQVDLIDTDNSGCNLRSVKAGNTDKDGRFTITAKMLRGDTPVKPNDYCVVTVDAYVINPADGSEVIIESQRVDLDLKGGGSLDLSVWASEVGLTDSGDDGAGSFSSDEQQPQADGAGASATSSAVPASGFSPAVDAAGPWLLRTGLVLAAVAFIGFFLWLTVLVARAAQRKGRSYWAWFWIAFFFLVPAAIIVAIMGPQDRLQSGPPSSPPAPKPSGEDTKRCPYCGEEILAIAKKCKHCGEFLKR